jgi:hypothetical protein
MMKSVLKLFPIFLALFFMLLPEAEAQLVKNEAGTILKVNPNTTLYIESDFLNEGTVDNDGTIKIDGSWTNNGSVDIGSIVEFSGTSTQTVSGNTTYDTVIINGPVDFAGNDSIRFKLCMRSGTVNGTPYYLAGSQLVYDGTTPVTTSDELPPLGWSNNPDEVLILNGAGVGTDVQRQVAGIMRIDGGGVLNSAGNIVLVSNAADESGMIDPAGTGSVNGLITMQRYIPGTYTGSQVQNGYESGYHYVGAAFNTADVNEFADFSPFNPVGSACLPSCNYNNIGTFFQYDETVTSTTAPYHYEKWADVTSVSQGRGYAAHIRDLVGGSSTVDVEGTYNHGGNVNVTGLTRSGGAFNGWNLISNPKPFKYDWDQVVLNGGLTNVYNAIYFWNPNTLQYEAYINDVGAPNGGSGLGGISTGASNLILPMQAFFVVVSDNAGGSVNFTHAEGTVGAGGSFYRTDDVRPLVRLQLSNANGYSDQTVVYGTQYATMNFDGHYDAFKNMSSSPLVPSLYSVSSDTNDLSINGITAFDMDRVIPLGVDVQSNGTVEFDTLEFKNIPATSLVYLEDKDHGVFHDLRTGGKYTATVNQNDAVTGRFYLHMREPAEFQTITESCDQNDGGIVINQGGSTVWDNYEILDAAGNIVHSGTNLNGQLAVNGLTHGDYTIRLHKDMYTVEEEVTVDHLQAVTADFVMSSQVVEVGEPVFFNDASIGASDYVWNFGDGTILNTQNPIYNYVNEGVFNVELYATNNDGCDDRITKEITVENKTTGSNTVVEEEANIFSHSNKIVVDMKSLSFTADAEVKVYAINGQLVAHERVENTITEITMDQLQAATYLVVLEDGDYRLTKQVFVSNQ